MKLLFVLYFWIKGHISQQRRWRLSTWSKCRRCSWSEYTSYIKWTAKYAPPLQGSAAHPTNACCQQRWHNLLWKCINEMQMFKKCKIWCQMQQSSLFCLVTSFQSLHINWNAIQTPVKSTTSSPGQKKKNEPVYRVWFNSHPLTFVSHPVCVSVNYIFLWLPAWKAGISRGH